MILALDTSTLTLSLALRSRDGVVLEHFTAGPPSRQSKLLPGVISELLARHGLTLAQLDGFAIGLGPGSFTGLRIGLATVKGLAYALQKPTVGISSLAVVALEALAATPNQTVFAAAVVKRGELYLGPYRFKAGVLEPTGPERALTVAQFAEAMREQPEAIAVGPAMVEYAEALQQLGIAPQRLLAAPLFPSAALMAAMAQLPPTYDAQALFALEPHYLRNSGAEDNPKFPPLPGPEPTARTSSH